MPVLRPCLPLATLLFAALPLLSACGERSATRETTEVLASTSLLADIASQIAGPSLRVDALIDRGIDPHGYQPTPVEMRRVAEAKLLLLVGAGFEGSLRREIVAVGSSPALLELAVQPEQGGQHQAHSHHVEEHNNGGEDPHLWLDPTFVSGWTDTLAIRLARLAPGQAEAITARASAYRDSLAALDRWIAEQIAAIAPESRVVVTDHRFLTHYAERYGLRVAATVMSSASTLSDPSAGELATLHKSLAGSKARALFTGSNAPSSLLQRLSEDSGLPLVTLYSGSLSEPDGPAANYLAYMRENTRLIVASLATTADVE